jgi:PKD repeat protein
MSVIIEKAEEYEVKADDTLEKIAEDAKKKYGDAVGDWKLIARYNWGTDEPREVVRALAETVGVKLANDLKQADWDTAIGSPEKIKLAPDADLPAAKLKIPKPFKKEGLALEKTHTVKVKPAPKPANAVSIPALDKWFIPKEEQCEVKYRLEGEAKYADKVQLDVYGSKYCECTDWNKGLGTYGKPDDLIETPVFKLELNDQAAERQEYDLPGAKAWKGQANADKGLLSRKTGAATERYVNVAFSPYTAHLRYHKADGDKKAQLILEAFWPQFEETKTEATDANIDHAGAKKAVWANAAKADRGAVVIKDKNGQRVHLVAVPDDKLAAGNQELPWDGKYRADAMNSKFADSYVDEDKPYAATVTTYVRKVKADSFKVKWEFKHTGGKLERGLLQIFDGKDRLVFQKPLAKGKLGDGKQEFEWKDKGKYADGVKNSKGGGEVIPEDMPYRVQLQAHTGIDKPEGLALAAMHTEVRLYVHPKTFAPKDALYDAWNAKNSLTLGPGKFVPGDAPVEADGTRWFRHQLAEFGFHPGPVTDEAVADEVYKVAMLEFKRSVPEDCGAAGDNFKRLLIADGRPAREENAKTKTAIKNIRDGYKRRMFGDLTKVMNSTDPPDLSDAEVEQLLPNPGKDMVVWADDRHYYTELDAGMKDENNRRFDGGSAEAAAFGLKNYRSSMGIGDERTTKDAETIARPWLPMQVGLALLSRTKKLTDEVDLTALSDEARAAMRAAVGPLRVDWTFDELPFDVSPINPADYDNKTGRSRRYVAWALDQYKATHTRKDTGREATYTNCKEDFGGIRPAGLASYYQRAFGLDGLSLDPWRATAVDDTESVATVIHDHIAAGQKDKAQEPDKFKVTLFEPLLGAAGAYFNPSRVAGDGYRVRAEVQFDKFSGYEFPNLEALKARYPVAPQAHTARLRVWRRSSFRGYVSWAAAEPAPATWPAYLALFRKQYRAGHVYFVHEGGARKEFAINTLFDPTNNAHVTRYKNIIKNNLKDATLKDDVTYPMSLKRDFVWPWSDRSFYGYPWVSSVNLPDADVYEKYLNDEIMESTWGKFDAALLIALLREVEKRGALRGHLLTEFASSDKFHLREYECNGNDVPPGSTDAPPHKYWSIEKGESTNAARRDGANCAYPGCQVVTPPGPPGPPPPPPPPAPVGSTLSETGNAMDFDTMPLWASGQALGATWLFRPPDAHAGVWTHEVGHHRHLEHAGDGPGAVPELHDSEANDFIYPDFTASVTAGNAPLTVTFNDTSAEALNLWHWEFGDGAFSDAQNPTHTFTAPGSYTVKLTGGEIAHPGTGDPTNVGAKTAVITVSGAAPPAPKADFTADKTTGAAPLAVAFTDTSTDGPTHWLWEFGDSGKFAATQNAAYTFDRPGTYTVKLTARNAYGTNTKTADITVTAPPAASATIDANKTTGVAPLEVSFDGFPFGKPTDWLWEFGEGGKYAATQKTSYTYERPGTYTVKLTVRDDKGVNSDTETVTVTAPVLTPPTKTNPAFAPVAKFTKSAATGAAPLEVSFTDLSTFQPDGWLWEFGDGAVATVKEPEHRYETPGVYTVKLTVRSAVGTDSKTATVTVTGAAPSAPTAAFTHNAAAPHALGTKIDFTDASTGNPTYWLWEFGDGKFATTKDASHTYDRPGKYTVKLTARNDYGVNDKSQEVEVQALPALAAAFTHDAAAPQPFGTPVNFTDASTGNPTHWLWEFGDGKYAVTQNATHTYDRPGTHTVKLTVRHDHGVNDKSEDVEIEEALKFDDVDARWMQWDRRCIMSYSRTAFGENEEYFCGKCILRNRGWKVRGIGHPGRNVKEP